MGKYVFLFFRFYMRGMRFAVGEELSKQSLFSLKKSDLQLFSDFQLFKLSSSVIFIKKKKTYVKISTSSVSYMRSFLQNLFKIYSTQKVNSPTEVDLSKYPSSILSIYIYYVLLHSEKKNRVLKAITCQQLNKCLLSALVLILN